MDRAPQFWVKVVKVADHGVVIELPNKKLLAFLTETLADDLPDLVPKLPLKVGDEIPAYVNDKGNTIHLGFLELRRA